MELDAIFLFQALVLECLVASHQYGALACCNLVCRRWRQVLTQLPIAFIDGLPEVMKTFRTRILYPGLHTLQLECYVGGAVRYVIKGLQEHMYYRPAVKAILKTSNHMLEALLMKNIHPGTFARPSMSTLLVVLKVYRGDVEVGLHVLRLIARYKSIMRALKEWDIFMIFDYADTVVLSEEEQGKATNDVDDFYDSIKITDQNCPNITALAAVFEDVREWIAAGTLLL